MSMPNILFVLRLYLKKRGNTAILHFGGGINQEMNEF